MKRIFRDRLLAVVLAFSMTVPVLADVAETVEKYRASFERRMNAELDESGKTARALRLNYIQALKELKLELGRAENLKGAAQVVAELEAIEDGEEAEQLPEDANPRIKNLRAQWERGGVDIRMNRNRKVSETVKIYLGALDKEKRRITRIGRIKDALLFEEEEKRVLELPEVKASIAAVEEPELEDDLAAALAGTKWSHAIGNAKPSGMMKFFSSGRGDYKGRSDGRIKWEVTGEHTAVVTSTAWKVPMILTFNGERSEYSGTMAGDNIIRKGRILP
ncbi:MAG: hypothetical protein GY889_04360 [Proteobacteria bacterium]|nr:hypothetical protein [Pseudomonadota bacterium]